ncbi:MAG: PaaI family thioesterase [Bacteroidales bacterium]
MLCLFCFKSYRTQKLEKFEESERYLHATWSPSEYYQGYTNILHGGIIATLLDEVGAWCINVKIGTAGVTSKLNISYLKPVYLTKGDISLRAEIIERGEKSALLKCELLDSTGTLCAEMTRNSSSTRRR